ncbi:glycoside hydrolase family 2 protein [Sunxiuqinia sp. A32]|uniref:glycoside hydrolase family 2 protein n=1 Tax=Sunxiuqinia sp. A32 TaxID=3461496 RepID=UPI00404676C1
MKIVHNYSNYKIRILLFLFLFSISAKNYIAKAAPQKKEIPVITLSSHPDDGKAYSWQMMRVSEIGATGEEISQSKYDTKSWRPAIIPGTALNSLVANGECPEPYFGQNNKRINKQIPDIADVGREFYHFWYRTTFSTPKDFDGKKVWLQFDGINYIADIWLNGHKLGSIKGMFLQKKFDVSQYIKSKGENCLAVSVEPVEYPGTMLSRKKENAAPNENKNGGDGKIGKNVTMLMTAGWDFTFHDGIRDRNTGIWRDVKVFASGDVTLENPFVKSKLPIPELSPARESISVEVSNHSAQDRTVELVADIENTSVRISKKVNLKAGEKQKVVLTPEEYNQLVIENPKLWWPINKGEQHLYTLNLTVKADGQVSDTVSKRFGIRDIRSDRNTPDQSRIFYVNGKRLFIRGSNWIPEAMLRTSKERTFAQLRYTKQAGINMLRLWGGGISESDYFFDLCDEMGFLVWHEFWMTGDTNPPLDTAVYFGNVRSTIERIRNHPSLAYYVSSNEQDNILDIKPILNNLDGTRGYQFQSECCGVHDGSPYKYENPMQYYDNTASNRGSRIDGFCPEYGTACLPVIESLRRMMPEDDLWPINKNTWDYLDGNGFHNMTTKYNTAVEQYDTPENIEDYAKKGQLVGAVAYRCIWENWNYNKYEYGDRFASGVLFWYHNSPVPQVCSRMWDWYLEPTAALYFAQDALEPLHAQFDFIKNTVSVYNELYQGFEGLRVNFRLVNMDMKTILEKETHINLDEDAVANDVLKIDLPTEKLSPVHFIKLEVYDKDDNLISDTFYWRSKNEYQGPWTVGGPLHGGFESLSELPKTSLAYQVEKNIENDQTIYTVHLTNKTDKLAFFNRLKMVNKKNDSLISPAFYSDNYFSLLPGENKDVMIEITEKDSAKDIQLVLEGFNVKAQIINDKN